MSKQELTERSMSINKCFVMRNGYPYKPLPTIYENEFFTLELAYNFINEFQHVCNKTDVENLYANYKLCIESIGLQTKINDVYLICKCAKHKLIEMYGPEIEFEEMTKKLESTKFD